MKDSYDKQNKTVKKLENRLVAFHFCFKYAKKSDHKIKKQVSQSHSRIIRGIKIKLASKSKNMQQESKKQKKHHHLSNFQLLKRKINYLETQQFLCDKNQLMEQKDKQLREILFCKKKSFLDKYRQNINNVKKQSERRYSSLNLMIKSQGGQSNSNLQLNFAATQNLKVQNSDWFMKKRQVVTQCAKRYFRPQSYYKKDDQLSKSVAQIKGTSFLPSGRINKSSINFY